ncbi:MAG: copper-binding protein [Nitrospinaceae bacterium]|jgi:Cu/Ag efflux protein CusF|nr:copper-binding protein [Nitrospinaceae bacterium]
MIFKRTLLVLSLVFMAGCSSNYVAQALPKNHPANPKAQLATYAPHRNPLNSELPKKLKQRPKVSQKKSLAEGEGKVIAVVPTSDQIVINHKKIEGFMDAMTMGYKVSSPSLLEGLKPGDQIRFIIDIEGKKLIKIIKQN